MSVTQLLSTTIQLEPLAPEPFARFGDVASRPTHLRRRYLPTSLDIANDASLSVWISSAAATGGLPMPVIALERHPFSAQSFVPLDPGRYLVIVCEADARGDPDLTTLRAFLADGRQSVTFARNVWHHSMTVLDAGMEFAVAMGMTGRGDDDVFQDLGTAVTIVAPQDTGSQP
jgi:ureidoglycolate lyase